MKKFNAKKVIVSFAVVMLLVGGTVAAAAGWNRWQGEGDTVAVQTDLDTLDRLLTAKEVKVDELNTKITALNTSISELTAALGLANTGNQTLTQQLTAAQAELTKEKAITAETKAILSNIEQQVGISNGDGKSVTQRVELIKSTVKSYVDGLNNQIAGLNSTITNLTNEKAGLVARNQQLQNELTTSGSEKDNLKEQLRHAVDDMAGLKVKSNGIVNKHLNK